MGGKIQDEIKKVGEIVQNGCEQVKSRAEKIEKAFENLGKKVSNKIEVNINIKIEGMKMHEHGSKQANEGDSSNQLKAADFEGFKTKVREDRPEFAVRLMLINSKIQDLIENFDYSKSLPADYNHNKPFKMIETPTSIYFGQL